MIGRARGLLCLLLTITAGCATQPSIDLIVPESVLFQPWWLSVEVLPQAATATPEVEHQQASDEPRAEPSAAPSPTATPETTVLASIPGSLFDIDSDVLSADLGDIAKAAKCFVGTFEVGGHTDSSGDEGYNLDLSERRARSVAAELVRLGLSSSDMVIRGYGDTRPRSDETAGDAEQARAQNRRVELSGTTDLGCVDDLALGTDT